MEIANENNLSTSKFQDVNELNAEEEFLLPLSEDELASIAGGFDAGGPIAEPIGKAVGALVFGAGGAAIGSVGGPGGAAVGAGIGVVAGQELGAVTGRLVGKGLSAIHNAEGEWWSFL